MPRTPRIQFTPLGDTDPFTPSPQRPVRVRARTMPADAHFEPHRHAWAQLAYCATGMVQVTAATPEEITYIVPPSRAVWIAPGARHAITVLEAAEFRTLYIDASATPEGWGGCRVLVVSALLRELIHALDMPMAGAREAMLTGLVLDELTHADTQALGVPLPRDKRLRALCEAVLQAPSERATLADWAADIGASERTVARLFREELGLSYQQWRQQAILAHALPLLSRGTPVSRVAAASGYASDSAFSAMFKAAMGQSPSHFLRKNTP
ncbi:AraC family transcriptional regulator [Variovorax terrae]|uniref:Helix-turn-helix transcriptional regulator n=1 Tax=Variovorax terrae TaxID=2923278 RepID=A0A9X1VXA6_9BURK|nr:helix-turn-helix transcriptional regulator [Variovorax terrae]MCJ0763754.1 helix-turn-helix transcriptional regulator [Variovorax terrae]